MAGCAERGNEPSDSRKCEELRASRNLLNSGTNLDVETLLPQLQAAALSG